MTQNVCVIICCFQVKSKSNQIKSHQLATYWQIENIKNKKWHRYSQQSTFRRYCKCYFITIFIFAVSVCHYTVNLCDKLRFPFNKWKYQVPSRVLYGHSCANIDCTARQKKTVTTYFDPKRNEKIFPSWFLGLRQNWARSSCLLGRNGSEPTTGSDGNEGGNYWPLCLTLCRR